MRKQMLFNHEWKFGKKDVGAGFTLEAEGEKLDLPHTWNSTDGQDGGNDYYRGTCWYVKEFARPETSEGDEVWLEFRGVAMTADVYVNGHHLCHHEGGYSTFRVNMTNVIRESNVLEVAVDNSKNHTVYPQKADFTFYGGIYRDVYIITVPATHFELGYYGGTGIQVTPNVEGRNAEVKVEAWVTGVADVVKFTIEDRILEAKVDDGHAECVFTIENVHLWDGVADPYLYTVKAELESGDLLETRFGCRSFAIDPENGFLLNGRPYRLCGAARHQDRQGVGNAITTEMQDEDMVLLREMGANTVRLAHYQHDQYFYDLCDEYGMIVWAEIPYITEHMPEGQDNTLSQMKELVVQNYNHPSIVCWGLSNEITVTAGVTDDIVENHKLLHNLCHKLDDTRPTTMAHAFMLDINHPFMSLSDICSYNLYYGWYIGDVEENDAWFDEFHAKHPNTVVGLSEYGADANPAYQNGNPEKGDWSEPYQALYHEHMLKMWSERPYIWAMHCWNMFDFGADGRNEGGKPGQNQKGLVTFDRKLKKDAFYIYKAYLSKEPFIHICGKRYVQRSEEVTEVKVYTNQSNVTLFVDGKEVSTQEGDKVFKFHVPISKEHTIEAKSGELSDTIRIHKVDTLNKAYIKEGYEIVNWFDRPDEVAKEGYYSILDSIADLKAEPRAAQLLAKVMERAKRSYGDVAKNVTLPESIQRQIDAMPLEKMLKQAGKALTEEMVKQLNNDLNQIPKKK
ncbi:glycoside hydrolase family 2 protein [Shouchella clausii]|uniref:glycoside hydrolase family 2 protein n=1 Tax=Shouchella clausii TaxID=79880 RepID=UPI000BA7433A|nr:glycoside hydrolase family 2 TIM barrel-domain containing protein [Shouchella clausii]PAD93758.1 beta-galactosidase [Shouchella clausii]